MMPATGSDRPSIVETKEDGRKKSQKKNKKAAMIAGDLPLVLRSLTFCRVPKSILCLHFIDVNLCPMPLSKDLYTLCLA